MKALDATNVPVPHALHYCSDALVIGTPFYVMEHVRGRVFSEPLPAELPAHERAAIYDSMNVALSRLHCVDYRTIGLTDFGRPGNYFTRQIERWGRQYCETGGTPVPGMDTLIRRLPEIAPKDDRSTIVHGDFRMGNLIVHPS